MSRKVILVTLFTLFALVSSSLLAQAPAPYGAPIGVEAAKKVAAVAVAEAKKNNWTMCIAIVDPGGNLVYLEKMTARRPAASMSRSTRQSPQRCSNGLESHFRIRLPVVATACACCSYKARFRSTVDTH